MSLFNNLDISLQEGDLEAVDLSAIKKTSLKLPDQTICDFLLTRVSSPKGAITLAAEEQRQPSFKDGVNYNFVILNYYKGNELVKVIDYPSVEDARYKSISEALEKGDITVEDAMNELVGLVTFPVADSNLGALLYVGPKNLYRKGYKKPADDKAARVIFNDYLSFQLGLPANVKKVPGLIVTAFADVNEYYDKKDKNEDGTIKEGARKRTGRDMTVWNKERKAPEVFPHGELPELLTAVITKAVDNLKDAPDGDSPF